MHMHFKGILLGKKSACQVRQDRLPNPPNYFVLHFILFIYFMAAQKDCFQIL